ncbi:hypothetical protein JL721_944 [Aureococcus anophagefferens]|nr:hypothetical protein JL721_944 [Aureococcus anophagefferens]
MGWWPLLWLALGAVDARKGHGSHGAHDERRGPGAQRYLTYNETEGLNNQRIALENAPHGHPAEPDPPAPRGDAAACLDVEACEDFLLDPPTRTVVEVPQDKTMYHMSLKSPKRWVLSKMKNDRELAPNVLTVNSRLVARAKQIIDKLGSAYDAAHLRTGDYFDALYPPSSSTPNRINKLRNVTMRRSRPLFLMTVRVPEGWGIGYDSVRTATSDFADAVRGISRGARCRRGRKPAPGAAAAAGARRARAAAPEHLDGPLYADELEQYKATRQREHGGSHGGHGGAGGHGRHRPGRGGGGGKPTLVTESYQIRASSLKQEARGG